MSRRTIKWTVGVHGIPPPQPVPPSTPSFHGSAVRKSDLPGTSVHVRVHCKARRGIGELHLSGAVRLLL